MPDQVTATAVNHIHGVGVYLHAKLIGEIAARPHVVVAEMPVYLKSAIREFPDSTEQPNRPFRNHVFPFEPKVDEVADEVQGLPLTPYFIQPPQKDPLPIA